MESSRFYINLNTDKFKPMMPSFDLNENERFPAQTSGEYRMNRKRRGKAVIFSHFEYMDVDLEEREGNKMDQRRITEEFKKLGFEVEICKDYSEKGLMRKLKAVAKQDHTDADCLAVVVMCHGREVKGNKKNGFGSRTIFEILALDKYYEDLDLFENFIGTKCPSLVGKPKLFFIQACRGQKMEAEKLIRQCKSDSAAVEDELTNEKRTQNNQTPDHADFLIVQANFEGTNSFRDKKKGTVFIQTLCDALKGNYEKEDPDDLVTLITSVTAKVSCDNGQMPTTFSTLTKKLYFRGKDYEANLDCKSDSDLSFNYVTMISGSLLVMLYYVIFRGINEYIIKIF